MHTEEYCRGSICVRLGFRRAGSRIFQTVWVTDFAQRFVVLKSNQAPVSPTSFATVGLNRGAFILTISCILGLSAGAKC